MSILSGISNFLKQFTQQMSQPGALVQKATPAPAPAPASTPASTSAAVPLSRPVPSPASPAKTVLGQTQAAASNLVQKIQAWDAKHESAPQPTLAETQRAREEQNIPKGDQLPGQIGKLFSKQDLLSEGRAAGKTGAELDELLDNPQKTRVADDKQKQAAAMGVKPEEATRLFRGWDLASQPQEFKELTLEEYDALSPDARAAVDFNGLLSPAIDADRNLISQWDKNGDGVVTLGGKDNEVQGEALKGYQLAYEKRYGTPAKNEGIVYAPATLGLLNQVLPEDKGGYLDDYLKGVAYITEEDIQAGLTAPKEDVDTRGQWTSKLAQGLQDFKNKTSSGAVNYGGIKATVNLESANNLQREQVVNALALSLGNPDTMDKLDLVTLDGTSSTNFASGGVNLSGLVDEEVRGSSAWSNNLYNQFASQVGEANITREMLLDPSIIDAAEAQGVKRKYWEEFVDSKKPKGKTMADYEQMFGEK